MNLEEFAVILIVLVCSLRAEARECVCTDLHIGVPSCDFDAPHECGWLLDGGRANAPQWDHIRSGVKGPLTADYRPGNRQGTEGGYIYLPRQRARPASITAQVSEGVTAMCIQFQYATQDESSLDLEVFVNGTWTVLHTFRAGNTSGQWETSGQLSCCFPKGPRRWVGFTSNSPGSMVALDHIEITLSHSACDDIAGDMTCFASPVPSPSATYPVRADLDLATILNTIVITANDPKKAKPTSTIEPHVVKNTQLLMIQELKNRQVRMLQQMQYLERLHYLQSSQSLQQIQNLLRMQHQLQQENGQWLDHYRDLQSFHRESMQILEKLDQLTQD